MIAKGLLVAPPNIEGLDEFFCEPNWKIFVLLPPFESTAFASVLLLPLSNVVSLPFVVVEGFAPKEKGAGTAVLPLLLFVLPNAKL